MIRERRITQFGYVPGARQTVELPKDAVFHQLQFSMLGDLDIINGAAPTATTLLPGFPFTLIQNLRVIRNGSDVVWQGTGAMLAKEHLYLNNSSPQARIQNYGNSSGGGFAAGTIVTAVTDGVTIPANSEGIAENAALFATATSANNTVRTRFSGLAELWFQLGSVDSNFWSTLVDARVLASFVIEVTWAQLTDVMVLGAQSTASISMNMAILSYDQDNVTPGEAFGTYKRTQQAISQAQWGSSGIQYLLSRGNLYQGIIFQTQAYKTGLTNPRPEQNVITEFFNRINTNYFLRDTTFLSLQGKNRDDGNLCLPYQAQSGSPRGFAYLNFVSVGDRISELVQTYTMDQFDLSLSIAAVGAAENGANDPAFQPVINILTQEVIPGKGVSPNASQGSQAGSTSRTSASPGGR